MPYGNSVNISKLNPDPAATLHLGVLQHTRAKEVYAYCDILKII